MTHRNLKLLTRVAVFVVLVGVLGFAQFKSVGGFVTRTILTLPRFIFEPVASASSAIRHLGTGLVSIRRLYVENAELKNRVQLLEQDIAKNAGVLSENETLKATLGFVDRPPASLVACTVLGRDPEGVTQALVVGCGVDKGLAVGQGVVSAGYLVGKVVLVRPNTAIVVLLTASTTFVDARVANKKASGVVRGSYGSGLLLDYITPIAHVEVGDLVTTAGINGSIPPDVLIGRISEVTHEAGALFEKVSVSSSVDFRDVRFVHVLKP